MPFMPNCRQVSQLVSESMDRPLPFFKNLMVRIHLRMCKYCRRFEQQLLKMREISRNINHHIETLESPLSLPDEARERIRRRLRARTTAS
ncbi:MAG: zf-HC2 domain-containing protein [Desulfosarcina sp.]|nr:zf-HC2 domain-containing protein [Desulfobacterales bacterium]